jgi:hypothetical protein
MACHITYISFPLSAAASAPPVARVHEYCYPVVTTSPRLYFNDWLHLTTKVAGSQNINSTCSFYVSPLLDFRFSVPSSSLQQTMSSERPELPLGTGLPKPRKGATRSKRDAYNADDAARKRSSGKGIARKPAEARKLKAIIQHRRRLLPVSPCYKT